MAKALVLRNTRGRVVTTVVYSEADYIITRNAKHFTTDHIPVLSPTDFIVVGR